MDYVISSDPSWVGGLRRWLLFTADAHTLYEQFGFVRTMYPERTMEIRRPYIGNQ